MTTEVLPDAPQSSDSPEKGPPQQSGATPRVKPRRVWLVRLLSVLFVVAVLVGVITYLPYLVSTDDTGPRLTHRITRGDLLVTVTEQGTLESSNNTEIKCKVRGHSTVTWVIPSGSTVEPGQELVRLDTKVIEEQFSLTKTNTFIATATLEETKANVRQGEIAIDAYEEGRFRLELQRKQQELETKKRNLRTANKMLERSRSLFKQGYVTELEVESNAFTVTQAELELKVTQTEIKVLNEYTKQMEMETMQGNLTASRSKLAADEAGLAMEIKRRNRAEEELNACVITAEKAGLVIYPSAAAWKRTPDITEGATVRKDQVLLLMPDLSKMQVKVGIHESIIDRLRQGLKATVTLPDRQIEATVSKVATVTKPAGWWTGNVVKYDTIIELPPDKNLKPGMSAEVEVVLAVHSDVLTIPVSAVVESDSGSFCWVKTEEEPKRRLLTLGDSNDVFIVVEAGLKEGEEVILNPTSFIDEAKDDELQSLDGQTSSDDAAAESTSASSE